VADQTLITLRPGENADVWTVAASVPGIPAVRVSVVIELVEVRAGSEVVFSVTQSQVEVVEEFDD
jgi:hypothetical protein